MPGADGASRRGDKFKGPWGVAGPPSKPQFAGAAILAPPRPSPDAAARRQTCGNGFPPNSLRVGYRASPGAAEPTQWMHVECMSQARWRTVPGMLVGLTGLTPRDRVRRPRPHDPYHTLPPLRWRAAPGMLVPDRSDAARLGVILHTPLQTLYDSGRAPVVDTCCAGMRAHTVRQTRLPMARRCACRG